MQFSSDVISYKLTEIIINKNYNQLKQPKISYIYSEFHSTMINKLSHTLVRSRLLFKACSFKFSSIDPQPNNEQQHNQKQQPKIPNEPVSTQTQLKQNIAARAEAKLRIARSQLVKFAKAQLDYEKMNVPTKQIETVTQCLKNQGFKINYHTQHGTRLQFYSLQTYKKPVAKPVNTQTQNKQPNQPQEQAKKQQQTVEQQEQQEQDYRIQMKILTSGAKQLTAAQNKFFDQIFAQKQDPMKQFTQKLMAGAKKKQDNLKEPRKGFVNFQIKSMPEKDLKNIFKNVNKTGFNNATGGQKNEEEDEKKLDDMFKEYTIYLRDSRVKSQDGQGKKWLKAQIMFQNKTDMHIYKLSIIDNMQQQIRGVPIPTTKYSGVQAKQLDIQILQLLYFKLKQVQEIKPLLLNAIYYYTGLYEQQFYRKWLQDLIDICK